MKVGLIPGRRSSKGRWRGLGGGLVGLVSRYIYERCPLGVCGLGSRRVSLSGAFLGASKTIKTPLPVWKTDSNGLGVRFYAS